jgi:oxaloacetate decarboxylase beta subunit
MALLAGWAWAGPTFGVSFPDTPYATLLKGTHDGLAAPVDGPQAVSKATPGTSGDLFDRTGRVIGRFEVILAGTDSCTARLDMEPGCFAADVIRIAAPTARLDHIPFTLEDPASYFRIDKGWRNMSAAALKAGAKGQLLNRQGRQAGLFRVVAVGEHESVGQVTNIAQGVFNRDIHTGEIQNYGEQILSGLGIVNLTYLNLIMLIIGGLFIYLGIAKEYEPLLLVPIGFGILVGNIPLPLQIFNAISIYMIDPLTHEYVFNTTSNSVLGMIYFGVRAGIFPPLIFLGIGALTDFSAMLSNPKGVLLGAAAQIGIFTTFLGALALGFSANDAASIGIIGGADGPTAIFLASRLSPALIGPIAIAAYSYMAMVPIIQPPIMKLLTTKKERLIRMKPGRKVSKLEKILFPVAGMIVTCLVAPGGLPLLGMLFFGNLLKESGVTGRLSKTASSALLDICTILLGLVVGASTSAQVFLTPRSILIFVLGCFAFGTATAGGVLFAKFMNLFLKDKINPLIGSAGVSAVPDSARVSEIVGLAEDPNNHLLMHAMGPNVAGVIGSAIAAGIFLGIF